MPFGVGGFDNQKKLGFNNDFSKKLGADSFNVGKPKKKIGRAHVRTPVTRGSRMPSSA